MRVGSVSGQDLSRIAALLSALALGILYWHITFSRYGVESNLVPLFEVLAFYFLWRGFRTKRLWSFITSGVLLGLSLYTYQAARMLPFLFLIFFVYRLLLERRKFVETYWKGTVLLAVAAFITFAPLGAYFVSHPEVFTLRAGQVNTLNQGQTPGEVIADNARKAMAMFLVRGDQDPRSNLPGRPVLDPILAAPFLLGALLVVVRLGRPQYGFLIIWFFVMLAPTVFTEYAPHFRRSLGATPVVAIAVALGLTGVLTAAFWLASRIRNSLGEPLRAVVVWLVVAALAASAFITFRDYFLIWGRSVELFSAFDVGIMDAMRHASSLPTNGEVYLSPIPRSHPSVEFATNGGQQIRSFDGRRGFVFPARPDVDATYIVVTDEDDRSLALLQRFFPQAKSIREGKTWSGRPYFSIFFVPARSHRNIEPRYPVEASLAGKVAFRGYDTPRLDYKPGDVIPLFLYWQAQETMKESYTVFTHLLGPWDEKNKTVVWGQQDRLPLGGTYLTRDWRKGDMVLDEYALPIRKDAPPGDYEIEVGMYLLEIMQRLPVIDPTTGKPVDDRILLGKVRVQQ